METEPDLSSLTGGALGSSWMVSQRSTCVSGKGVDVPVGAAVGVTLGLANAVGVEIAGAAAAHADKRINVINRIQWMVVFIFIGEPRT